MISLHVPDSLKNDNREGGNHQRMQKCVKLKRSVIFDHYAKLEEEHNKHEVHTSVIIMRQSICITKRQNMDRK